MKERKIIRKLEKEMAKMERNDPNFNAGHCMLLMYQLHKLGFKRLYQDYLRKFIETQYKPQVKYECFGVSCEDDCC
jgi:hypothetical protein